MDAIAQFKETQKQGWTHFAPLESISTAAAARLVRHAHVQPGMRVLDVACGTGVVAITAARSDAHVTAIDLTPELLEHARENARIVDVAVEFHEADVEHLPFADGEFDVVVSQFGHMFAPLPDHATREMLRVLKPGGTIAFSTWPPELLVGRTMALAGRLMPPPPEGVVSPVLWGDPNIVRQRLGSGVLDIVFDRDCILVPALSVPHYRIFLERNAGPLMKLVARLRETDPGRLETFRQDFDNIVAQYFRDNLVRQDYLLTRATKALL